MKIAEHFSLKSLHTFDMEVNTRYFAEACTREEIQSFFQKDYPSLNVPLLLLGGGSNLLFTRNFEGCVLKISTKGITLINDQEPYQLVRAEAGENWEQFVEFCVAQGLGGLENLALIPGNVGSSPIQNIGAYGVEVKDSFHSLEALNIETGAVETFDKNACEFGYRTSVFKTMAKGRYIILSVTFRLSKQAKIDTTYGAISTELEKQGIDKPGIADVAKAVSDIRRSKLPDPKVIGNAGSFFKNPTISAFEYYRMADEHRSLVAYNLNNGYYKLAAGWLIEQCGWKGFRKGDAGVHAHQALILVNYGNATGQDILNLANEIIASVDNKFGVTLEPEVNIL